MRAPFTIVLIITILFSGGYFYQSAQAICAIPLPYRIGVLDDRFDLSFEEARVAIADAEGVWEDATEKNLFTYSETADFAINFIFDERQALADAEDTFKERLDATEQVNEALRDTYDELVAELEAAERTYEADLAAYESRLTRYNQTVDQYNAEGGAPREALDALEADRVSLDRELTDLNVQISNLSDLVDRLNSVGDRSNQLINTYNQGVRTYNQTFGDGREFTQGDYVGDAINIYTFETAEELRLVLVHELGHALDLGHVEDETAAMHFLLGAQTGYELTAADIDHFNAVCGLSTLERIQQQFARLLGSGEGIEY